MAEKNDKLMTAIEKALEKQMKGLDTDDMPPDLKLKAIQTAINWVKVKHAVKEDEEFDPASLG